MTPVLRGENGQPGDFSLFYNEVDDVLAATNVFLQLPYVDAGRVYVAGHSTGGSLAMLEALASNRFRAAASFSGSPDQRRFSADEPALTVFDPSNPREFMMRSPLAFAGSFKCPVRLYYGDEEGFFAGTTQETARRARAAGKDAAAVAVSGDHFSALPEEMRRSIDFFRSLDRPGSPGRTAGATE